MLQLRKGKEQRGQSQALLRGAQQQDKRQQGCVGTWEIPTFKSIYLFQQWVWSNTGTGTQRGRESLYSKDIQHVTG